MPTSPEDKPPSDTTRSWLTTPQPPSTPPSPSTPPADDQPPAPNPPSPETTYKPARATIGEVVGTIKPADFLKVHETPCSKQGFLTGIGTGAAVGVLRWILGLPIPKAANWAVGTGAIGALAQYEYCQYKRRVEKEKMLRMVEVVTARQAREKAEAQERAREARERREREEAEKRQKSWWKVW
ncbi:hypothetical protein QBC47DRAFT_387894 [Echria macrotheca]|uniref:Cytochrome c oxidase assembly protein COX20, mitochondrial n=1 Tax=Echria macrotheca TaxID=438768 RepID=A0AAJ0B7K3_9PEZI|nr:hypothetical protein QBC47DRAFT_387894 [Echria macrotheca]